MNTFIEILKVILPACITGLVTFMITKYTYYRNVPLDKMEITYNRVYYPLYCLAKRSLPVPLFISKSQIYLLKYNKYVDRSTYVAFNFLKDNPHNRKAYKTFYNNIMDYNSKLRRRLGYLEPNVWSMYTYSNPEEKRLFRLVFEGVGMYLTASFSSIISIDFLKDGCSILFLICLVGFSLEMLIIMVKVFAEFLSWIYNLLKNFIYKLYK